MDIWLGSCPLGALVGTARILGVSGFAVSTAEIDFSTPPAQVEAATQASGARYIVVGPDDFAPGRRDQPEREQIAASDPARALFIMGNHDWHIEGSEGWDRVLAQRRFLETF